MGGARFARTLALGSRAAILAAALAATTPALSQDRPAAPTEAERKTAAQRFADGEKAYKSGDYALAAAAFEDANRLAPHPSASWNAARAWQRAGENARAANLYARYLREAPAGDPDRSQSAAALAELTAKLGRIEITGSSLTELTVDQRPVEASPVYVNPGTHVVHAKVAGTDVTRAASADAGAVVSVAMTVDPTPAPPATASPVAPPTASAAPAASSAAPPPPPEPTRQGWHPAAFFVAGGVTLFAGAWTAWSGLDTMAKKDTYDKAHDTATSKGTVENKDASNKALDDGKKAQLRTNFLIGLTAAGAVFTGITGIWLVGWSEPAGAATGRSRTTPRSVQASVGPGSVALRGSF